MPMTFAHLFDPTRRDPPLVQQQLKRRSGRWTLPPSLGVLATLASASVANAATTGGSMPWDTPLTTIENDLTGPVAVAVTTISVVMAGLGFALGGEGTFMRRGFGIVFGLAIALMGTSAIMTFFGSTSGAVF
jgi:type IV secretion system protein VirB2